MCCLLVMTTHGFMCGLLVTPLRFPFGSLPADCTISDTAEPEAVASLLKTIEEPPATTTFVLLAEEVPAEHVTIASRCFRVDFPPLADEVVAATMVAEGMDADRAAVLAEAAAGSIERARLLAEDPDLHGRRNAWHSVPSRLDGSGAAVAVIVEELRAMIDGAQAPLVARHADEIAVVAEREEAFGSRGSGRSELVGRQKRELRRLRDDELRFGLATLSRVYRDSALAASEAGLPADASILHCLPGTAVARLGTCGFLEGRHTTQRHPLVQDRGG